MWVLVSPLCCSPDVLVCDAGLAEAVGFYLLHQQEAGVFQMADGWPDWQGTVLLTSRCDFFQILVIRPLASPQSYRFCLSNEGKGEITLTYDLMCLVQSTKGLPLSLRHKQKKRGH